METPIELSDDEDTPNDEGNRTSSASKKSKKSTTGDDSKPVPRPRLGILGQGYQAPVENIDGETLLEEFGSNGGTNAKWTCPIDSHSDSNITRLHEHCLAEHRNHLNLLALVELSINHFGRGDKKKALLEQLRRIRNPAGEGEKKPLFDMASFNAEKALKKALSAGIVVGNEPFTVCEQDWVYQIFEAGCRHGFKARVVDPRRARAPTADGMRVSRRTLVAETDLFCAELIASHLKIVQKSATVYGCTQVSDGRSNIRNDPLVVFGVIAGNSFFPQGAHNAGAWKKDASYLKNRSVEYLNGEDLLGDHTFASVSDGAQSCLNALNLLEDEEFLIPVRCQSHAVSLFAKNVATKLFSSQMARASKVIDFIRSRQRVNSTLKRKTNDRSVMRFVPTRFGTYIIGVGRLLLLKAAIQDLPSDEDYLRYKDDQPVKVQRETFDVVETIIRDVNFWDELKFFHRVMLPAVRALRLMDSSSVRAKDVVKIWEALEDRLVVELMHEDFKHIDVKLKKDILAQYCKDRDSAHRPVFDAAWVLDPANKDEVQRLASGEGDDNEKKMWATRRDNTLATLQTMVKRRMLVRQKQSFRVSSLVSQSQETGSSSKRAKVHSEQQQQFEINQALHDEAATKEFETVKKEFMEYCSGLEVYAPSSEETIADTFWFGKGESLNFYAIRLLNIAATTSDIERMHKVYSGIHTAERNRLDEDRVDRLSLARIASRAFQVTPKPFISQLDSFCKTSFEDELALYKWGCLENKAVSATLRSIHEPTVDGFKLDPAVPAGPAAVVTKDDERPSADIRVQTVPEPDEEDEEQPLAITMDVVESEDEPPLFTGTVTSSTRSKRRVSLSAKLLGGLHMLGMSTSVFERE